MNVSGNYDIKPVIVGDLDKFLVENHLKELTERINFLPSLMNFLNEGPRFKINPEESQNLYKLVSCVFLTMIYPIQPLGYDKETVENLIFPALFTRCVLIRRPHPNELKRLEQKFYETNESPDDDFKGTVNEGGYKLLDNKSIRACFVLQTKMTGHRIYGAIDYKMKGKKCTIYSLSIHKKYQGQKLGTLLLAAAIFNAQSHGCKTVSLESSKEGRKFYLALNFMPYRVRKLPDFSWWEHTAKDAQLRIVKDCDFWDFIFKMCDINEIANHVKSALVNMNNTREERSRREKIVLPREPFDLQWMHRENYDTEKYEIEGSEDDFTDEEDEDQEMQDSVSHNECREFI